MVDRKAFKTYKDGYTLGIKHMRDSFIILAEKLEEDGEVDVAFVFRKATAAAFKKATEIWQAVEEELVGELK